MDEHVDYLEFVTRLRQLVREGASVTLRMVTDDRHFVNVGLNAGRIVSLHHGPRRGTKALQLITSVSGGGISLLPSQNLRPQPDLPSTQEILRVLDEGEIHRIQHPQSTRGTMANGPDSSGFAPLEMGATTAFTNRELVQELYSMEEALLRIIGPIAKMVVKDTVQEMGQVRSRDDLLRLAETLSREIDDPNQARVFVEQITKRI